MIGNFRCVDCTCNAASNEKKFELDLNNIKDEDKVKCPNNKSVILKHIGNKVSLGISTGQFKNGRPLAEKNKRRTDDFNKNTLPTLTGFERKHFESKKKKK